MRPIKADADYQMDVDLSVEEMVEIYYGVKRTGEMLSEHPDREQYLVTYDSNEAFEKEAALTQFEELGKYVHYVPPQVASRTWRQMAESGTITFFRILVNDEHRLKLWRDRDVTLICPWWDEPIRCNVVTFDVPAEKRHEALIEFHNCKMEYFSELEQARGALLTVEDLERRRHAVLERLKQQIQDDEKLQKLLARFPEKTRAVITGAYLQGVFECMNHPYRFPDHEELGEFMRIEDELHHRLPPEPAAAGEESGGNGEKTEGDEAK